MDNLVEVLPNINGMTGKVYTKREWLTFYKNAWTRNAMARAIDVLTDRTLKAENPDQIVESGDDFVPVKVRLETRKINLQDALNILGGIETLLAIKDSEFDTQILSKEALAVDEDMIPKEAPAPEVTPETPVEPQKEEAPAEESSQPVETTKEEEISNEAKV